MKLSGFLNNIFGQNKFRVLTQEQNEALIDAMTYAMLIDRHIAAAEQAQLTAQVGELKWRAAISPEQYINESIRRAREAISLKDAARSYCNRISLRLQTAPLREEAFDLSVGIAHADGVVDEAERALLDTMADAFGVNAERKQAIFDAQGVS